MENFNISEFINKINAIEIDRTEEEWVEKFNEEFDKQVSTDEIQSFIEIIKKIDEQTFNEIIAGMDGLKFEKLMSKINVKNFIEVINKMNGVTVLAGKEKEPFINEYLEKLQTLLEDRKRANIDSTIGFLRTNLDRNIKCVVHAEFSDDEKAIKENEYESKEVDKESIVYKSMARKTSIGAKPGQYVQGRIVYSNLSQNDILKYHETTHAARNEIFDENGNNIVAVDKIDNLKTVNNTLYFLKQFPSTTATAGYDYVETDRNGRISGEKDGPKLINDYTEMSDLMEICTETVAGLMNNHDDDHVMKFKGFWVPKETMEMSAISFFRDARDLLIMAIGSDDFIFDMLEPNAREKIKDLNEKMNVYKEGSSIVEYLKIAGEHATLEGVVDQNRQAKFVKKRRDKYLQILENGKGVISNGSYKKVLSDYEKCQKAIHNGEEDKYVEDRMNEYKRKMESYATDMFLSRMQKYHAIDENAKKDKNAQIDYFKGRLKTKEAKNRVNTMEKNQALSKKIISSMAKQDEVTPEIENAMEAFQELEKDKQIEINSQSIE